MFDLHSLNDRLTCAIGALTFASLSFAAAIAPFAAA
jgi:hypothetical protein